MKWRLPFMIRRKDKLAYGLFIGLFTLALYLATNHFSFFEPTRLQFSKIDRAIPFLPVSIWVYLSAFVLIPIPYFRQRNLREAQKYLYSFLFLSLFSALIFLLYPTSYPREFFPLPTGLDVFTALFFSSLRQLDTMNNCAPSLHVSGSLLAAVCLWSSTRPKNRTWTYFFWAGIVALSTMTTKQHYFIDVLTGALLGLATYALFFKKIVLRSN